MPGRLNTTFASDNTAGLCPEALSAISAANIGRASSYGEDPFTARATQLMREVFETDCETFFVFNGTAANSLALSALCARHHSILCHEVAHIHTDECAAPEFFTGGGKLVPLPGARAKLTPASITPTLTRGHDVHHSKPGALSLTQSTEHGTLYTSDEIHVLATLAHNHGLAVHMDGARFANAGAASSASPADLTWRAGVDVLSFGGTKNGLLSTEAVVFFNRDLARDFAYRVKQSGQLASKQRFASAQWCAILEEGAWLRHAAHANAQTQKLAAALRALPGVSLVLEPEVNAVFVTLAPAVAQAMFSRGWRFDPFIGDDGYRLMCSWDTRDTDITAFVVDLRESRAGL